MMMIVSTNKDNTALTENIEKGIIIIIIHFIYTLKSEVQALFSSVHIVRSKYNIIQVNILNTYI